MRVQLVVLENGLDVREASDGRADDADHAREHVREAHDQERELDDRLRLVGNLRLRREARDQPPDPQDPEQLQQPHQLEHAKQAQLARFVPRAARVERPVERRRVPVLVARDLKTGRRSPRRGSESVFRSRDREGGTPAASRDDRVDGEAADKVDDEPGPEVLLGDDSSIHDVLRAFPIVRTRVKVDEDVGDEIRVDDEVRDQQRATLGHEPTSRPATRGLPSLSDQNDL